MRTGSFWAGPSGPGSAGENFEQQGVDKLRRGSFDYAPQALCHAINLVRRFAQSL